MPKAKTAPQAPARAYYDRYRTDAPVLFIPNRHEMHLTFTPLPEAYDVVTWDPRDRGPSDRPANLTRYGIDAEIADVEAIRGSLDHTPAVRLILHDSPLAIDLLAGHVVRPRVRLGALDFVRDDARIQHARQNSV